MVGEALALSLLRRIPRNHCVGELLATELTSDPLGSKIVMLHTMLFTCIVVSLNCFESLEMSSCLKGT